MKCQALFFLYIIEEITNFLSAAVFFLFFFFVPYGLRKYLFVCIPTKTGFLLTYLFIHFGNLYFKHSGPIEAV